MWTRVEAENFKSLRGVSVDFERLTVLVGPNGAGKSSVLLAVQLLADLTVPPPPGVAAGRRIREQFRVAGQFDPGRLRTRGVAVDATTVLHGTARPGAGKATENQIELLMRPARPGDPSNQDPWLALKLDQTKEISVTHDLAGRPDGVGGEHGARVAEQIARLSHGPAVQLSLSARTLAAPSFLEAERAEIRPDGYGLPSLLATMAATDRSRIEAVEQALRQVVPRAMRIRTPPSKVTRDETQIITVAGQDRAVEIPRDHVGHRLQVEMQGAGWLDADLLSDGTLIALGVLTVLHAETCPKLLLIDDLDHSLHPTAYGQLVQSLRAVLEQQRDLQIVCTTHAPYLLDEFAPEEVRVLSLDEAGHTAVKALVEYPEWSDTYRGSLSTGEFWSSVGSDWVSGSAGR